MLKSKTIGILQPSYLPWIGYFDQIARSDVFVFYDDVQYDKNGWRNRNLIKTAIGSQWLTVPVLLKGKEFPLIKDVEIDNSQKWVKKHVSAIEQSYRKCEHYDEFICDFLTKKTWINLSDLTSSLIMLICSYLELPNFGFRFSSEIWKSDDTIQRLIDIIKVYGGTHFIEGSSGRNYMDEDILNQFKQEGIEVVFQDYQHPVYEQRYGEFVSHLSIIDLIFNCGKDKSRELLRGSNV